MMLLEALGSALLGVLLAGAALHRLSHRLPARSLVLATGVAGSPLRRLPHQQRAGRRRCSAAPGRRGGRLRGLALAAAAPRGKTPPPIGDRLTRRRSRRPFRSGAPWRATGRARRPGQGHLLGRQPQRGHPLGVSLGDAGEHPAHLGEVEAVGDAAHEHRRQSVPVGHHPLGLRQRLAHQPPRPQREPSPDARLRVDRGAHLLHGEARVAAIDGKTLRRSYDKANSKSAIHMVSAWATANHLSLGQTVVDQKSNEITAIPELLKILELSGCLVTIDAMGCQVTIAQAIVDAGADYVLAVKGNQKSLHNSIARYFKDHESDEFARVKVKRHGTQQRAHGREETRRYFTCLLPEQIADQQRWPKLKAIGMAINETLRNGKRTREVRYYILSKALTARLLGKRCAVIGRSRIAVTGNWTSRSRKTSAAFERDTPMPTSAAYDAQP